MWKICETTQREVVRGDTKVTQVQSVVLGRICDCDNSRIEGLTQKWHKIWHKWHTSETKVAQNYTKVAQNLTQVTLVTGATGPSCLNGSTPPTTPSSCEIQIHARLSVTCTRISTSVTYSVLFQIQLLKFNFGAVIACYFFSEFYWRHKRWGFRT